MSATVGPGGAQLPLNASLNALAEAASLVEVQSHGMYQYRQSGQ
jgi:hypothetical protein